ncbi:hypothetical protein TorRG33x02_018830 [Trema orientale]|uniref:Uncharacterized protein n=1 Tax=Trema orientale TaxID=63057 RepID=A0A2P5FWE1_TREOI|nr:hypothetical protein TorRG33x02_018830 [Trema orientale]
MVAVASNNLRQKEKDPNKLRKVPILERVLHKTLLKSKDLAEQRYQYHLRCPKNKSHDRPKRSSIRWTCEDEITYLFKKPKRSSISHNYDELVKCLLKHRSSPSESERLSEEELAFLDDRDDHCRANQLFERLKFEQRQYEQDIIDNEVDQNLAIESIVRANIKLGHDVVFLTFKASDKCYYESKVCLRTGSVLIFRPAVHYK